MLVKIIIVCFVLFALSRLILKFKDSQISLKELIGWCVLWIAVIIATLLPWTTDVMANYIGVGRGVDAIIYISIIIIFYGLFRITVKLENIENEITKIVRKDTLSNKK